MSSSKDLANFPDLESKLQKPAKLSAFEKQKAEAEAKRQREAAETAAVYEDFVKSFDREDDDSFAPRPGPAPRARPGFGGPPPSGPSATKRHFGVSALKTGPGSLGPPPTSFVKKRSFQDFSRSSQEKGSLGLDKNEGTALPVNKAFETSDGEDAEETRDPAEERAIAKPTLRLSNLPPATSPSTIKALMPETLNVEDVRMLYSTAPAGSERKSLVAIVTLSAETPANEMDMAVSTLQNRYLGLGYHLSLHRHLSSAVVGSGVLPNLSSSSSGSHPFGAKPVEQPSGPDVSSHRQFQRGIAPPSSYGQLPGVNRSSLLHVPVKPPQDILTIRSINKVIEQILEHGPEFEALLMTRPEVRREEKWSWIWDARSEGGIWYRWRLWEIITGPQARKGQGKYIPLFDGGHAWKCPDKRLPHEYVTKLDEFISDSDYDSSDDEDPEGDGNRDNQPLSEKTFLSPLEKAKLVHLLARLPTTISRLRKGDIARVTTFAVTHASRGADEVVDLIVSNVEQPFSLTSANLTKKKLSGNPPHDGEADEAMSSESADVSAASLVALYVVSDILSSSSTSGVRHAWRFRQLFENALRARKVFEYLGLMPERLGWGRMRAEKWKRSVGLVLHLWEGWCVFPTESQGLFTSSFENPPSQKVDQKMEEHGNKRGKWKVVEATQGQDEGDGVTEIKVGTQPAATVDAGGVPAAAPVADGIGAEPMDEDDVEGEPIDEDDVVGEPIDEDDVEGETIVDEVADGDPMEEDQIQRATTPQQVSDEESKTVGGKEEARQGRSHAETEANGRGQPRKRMRAVDMFADSEGSDG
ncbi:hypothetical protein S40288_06429 [Stachybotrys chartarum IBT 40288]|nr:hypothetical protein S40288_06429 [Stachybotrys chartarum IBT 40288]